MRQKLILLSLALMATQIPAKSEELSWARFMSGRGIPWGPTCIVPTSEGGFIVGSRGPWIAEFDRSGKVLWQKLTWAYGGTTRAGAAGELVSAGARKGTGTIRFDATLCKLTASGDLEWARGYGSAADDKAFDVQSTSDRGYVFCGSTKPFRANGLDALVVKLDSQGDIVWQKAYGTTDDEEAFRIMQSSDGGYLVSGLVRPAAGSLYYDAFVLKLDSAGQILWQKALATSGRDLLSDMIETTDGEYALVGELGLENQAWVIVLDSIGRIRWQKTYGTGGFSSVSGSSDGGFLVCGAAYLEADDWYGTLALKLRANGKIAWQRGLRSDSGVLVDAPEGGYFLAAYDHAGQGTYRLTSKGALPDVCEPIVKNTTVAPAKSAARMITTNAVTTTTTLAPYPLSATTVRTSAKPVDKCLFPDLTGFWLGVESSGNTLSGKFVCQNVGTGRPRPWGSIYLCFYLSGDPAYDPTDEIIDSESVDVLDPGESSQPIIIKYTSSAGVQGKYLLARIDADDDFFESDETNNTVAAQIPSSARK